MSVNLLLNGVWPGSNVEVRHDQWVQVPVVLPVRQRCLIPLILPMELPDGTDGTLDIVISIVHPDYEEWIRAVRFHGSAGMVRIKQVPKPLVIYAPRPTGQRKLLL